MKSTPNCAANLFNQRVFAKLMYQGKEDTTNPSTTRLGAQINWDQTALTEDCRAEILASANCGESPEADTKKMREHVH